MIKTFLTYVSIFFFLMTQNAAHSQNSETKNNTMGVKEVNVVTIKWGSLYGAKDVNRIYKMVKANLSCKYKLRFHCFTDDSKGLDKSIESHPLPVVNVPKGKLPYAYQKEVGLCRDDLGGLKGKRVLFFDLDVVVTGVENIKSLDFSKDVCQEERGVLDGFFELPQGDDFYIIYDWHFRNGKRKGRVGNASVYSWLVGSLGYVVKDYEKDPDFYVKKYYTASQEYLSDKVIERFGKLNFWPTVWVESFKEDLLPVWFLRRFKAARRPSSETKICAFHGDPKIEDSVAGVWPIKVKNPFIKKIKAIYKTILPASWVKEYLPLEN